jgi:hypothetical protein
MRVMRPRKQRQRGEQGMAALLTQAQAWDASAGRGGDGAVSVCRASGPGDRDVADSLEAEEAPVGGVADLPQRGQIRRSFPDPEIVVSVIVVLVRGAFPYCLIVVCLSSTCRLGVTRR